LSLFSPCCPASPEAGSFYSIKLEIKKAHPAIGIGLDIVHKKPYSSHSFTEADSENDE